MLISLESTTFLLQSYYIGKLVRILDNYCINYNKAKNGDLCFYAENVDRYLMTMFQDMEEQRHQIEN